MIPIKIRLMDYIRKQGGSVKNNDNRIPALLKRIKSMRSTVDPGVPVT